MNTSHCFKQKTTRTFNKKGALTSSEDVNAPCIGNTPAARMQTQSLRQPGYPFMSGPVALRHQITLDLPFRKTYLSFNQSIFFLSDLLMNSKGFFSCTQIFFKKLLTVGVTHFLRKKIEISSRFMHNAAAYSSCGRQPAWD